MAIAAISNMYTQAPRAERVYRFELVNGQTVDVRASSYREALLKLQGYKKLRGL